MASLGNFDEAIRYVVLNNKLLELTFPKKEDSFYFTYGQNLLTLAGLYLEKKEFDTALKNANAATAAFEKVSKGKEPMLYVSKRNIADIYILKKDKNLAIQNLKAAIQMAQTLFGNDHPGLKEDIELLSKLESASL